VEARKNYRKLPLKIWNGPMDLSAETERMLDDAMVRLDVDKPDLAMHAALKEISRRRLKADGKRRQRAATRGNDVSQAVSPVFNGAVAFVASNWCSTPSRVPSPG
jgi:hypothetical protein